MRRALLDLLLCPRCHDGGLSASAAADLSEVTFGPLTCTACHATFPVAEGVVDLLGEGRGQPAGSLQRGLERPLLARSYENRLRPLMSGVLGGKRLDRESELVLYRSLLGAHESPLLDLGCGTGLFSRRLARSGGFPAVIGMDRSRAMLEEAVAQAREAHLPIELVRAEAPRLPFRDGTLGGILHADALHYLEDLEPLFSELFRVLASGARYVVSTYEPPGRLAGAMNRLAGLHPRSEKTLRNALEGAGFKRVERLRTDPSIVFVATRL